MASASFDALVCWWDLTEADPKPILFNEHESWIKDVAFNQNGLYLSSSGKDRSVVLYMLKPDELEARIRKQVKRNFTQEEWNFFIGKDIPYENTLLP